MKKRNFLVADDDENFHEILEEILLVVFPDDDINILHAINGSKAIQLFDESLKDNNPIDVVITDYAMPEASGSDVIRHVMDKHPTPVIVVSAVPEAKDKDFIQEGAIYFLPKPFDVETAREVMEKAVGLKIIQKDIDKAMEAIGRLKKIGL
ncbi:response regulator [candidate division KSB1 bacterium]